MNNVPEFFKERHHFLAYPFIESQGIVGVVHRDKIGLGNKLWEAMLDSAIIMYNGFLLAAIMGVLIWCVVSIKGDNIVITCLKLFKFIPIKKFE